MEGDRRDSKYRELLEHHTQILEEAQSRKGQVPDNRKSKEDMYSEFMIRPLVFLPAYWPCTTPLAELEPTTIAQLKLETHHRGAYLLLRAITPPNRSEGIYVLAEDGREDAVLLQLYHQENENIRKATDIVDVGTVLLVKEPFFRQTASGDYALRVDHPSDIVHIEKNDDMYPDKWLPKKDDVKESAEEAKSRGNSAVVDGENWKAIREYTNAISHESNEDKIKILKCNRSLAYLRTKQFEAALSDTGYPNFGPKPLEKVLYRAAKSLYSLQRFTDCDTVLRTLCASSPNNEQAAELSEHHRRRCLETMTGDYDFKQLQEEAEKLQPMDHATWLGPTEIRDVAHKGRGLFVTKAVKAGDLLLCEKAFGYAPGNRVGNSEPKVLLNLERQGFFNGSQVDLISLIVQELRRNPSLAPAFFDLHQDIRHPPEKLPVDELPAVDTFLVERIISLNAFNCPQISNLVHKFKTDKSSNPPTHHSTGVWTHASHINHSCLCNARRSFIGDMMVVRATEDLAPDTEITTWYVGPGNGVQENLKQWNFACTCAICEDEKNTEAATGTLREKLLKQLKDTVKASSGPLIDLDKADGLLQKLHNTYSRSMIEVPRLSLWGPHIMLTRLYLPRKNIAKALESLKMGFTALGFTVVGMDHTLTVFKVLKWGLPVDDLVEAFKVAQIAFERIGAWDNARAAMQYAKTAYKMVIGEDATFEKWYGELGI